MVFIYSVEGRERFKLGSHHIYIFKWYEKYPRKSSAQPSMCLKDKRQENRAVRREKLGGKGEETREPLNFYSLLFYIVEIL